MITKIINFRGEYDFLSNAYPCDITLDNEVYPSVEHAFQAAKTSDHLIRYDIRMAPTAADAKRLGRSVELPADWDSKRIEVMTSLLKQKFFFNIDLKVKLLATDPQELVQGNMRRDRFWGVDSNGIGENQLGRILMSLREELRLFDVPLLPAKTETVVQPELVIKERILGILKNIFGPNEDGR